MSKLIFIICLCSVAFGQSKKVKFPQFEKTLVTISKSVDTIIPKQPDESFIRFYNISNNWLNKLNIENKKSNFTIRIWFGVLGLNKTQTLLIITKTDSQFSGRLYKFNTIRKDKNILNDSLVGLKIRDVRPKCGWVKFTDNFFCENFTSLFNLDKNSGDPPGIDDPSYYIEIVYKNHYWLSVFDNPLDNSSSHPDVFNAKKTFRLLQREFLLTN